jgi:cellulose synthase/poly-beta-1,6-N-acetylglucosamine synthase-like glycosyltransferase
LITGERPHVRGKFIFAGDTKLYVRGVTYGAFRPDEEKREYRDLEQIDRDFRQMAAAGFNAVRIPHTMPPIELLDIAALHGLRVMVGLSAEQYAGYLADPEMAPDVSAIVRERVAAVKGHPAILCYALGNEISASMVRWIGRVPVERYLERLYAVVKGEDPDALVTYVNYPSTEYLQLPFLDFVSFNVYLESQDRLRAYLARLQNLAGDRPLLMSEMGLDSMRNGLVKQGESLEWQIRTTFASGCSGAFVFSWTDEWYRGGEEVDDWAFGLTDRERLPKPALAAVQRAFAEVPYPVDATWPRMSVVVCVYNGEETIEDTCEGLEALDYPNYEVIVVDDGSTDSTADIVSRYPTFRLIRTPNRGLSCARNTGMEAATGEIVAYTDGDARPDPEWLTYLAAAFRNSTHVGIGGWNIAPPGDGWFASCVANSPGGPVHVLLTDTLAEHIPGCCMAFRKSALEAIGGFDPQFRAAGDDVDVCWRLQERGWTLGFTAPAMVWHHNRNSLRAYWKQQQGYGKAEALLERKWPEKYNSAGHLTWGGRLYGRGLTIPIGRAGRIYQGMWGSAPFQRLDPAEPSFWQLLPLMPEWHLFIAFCILLTFLGLEWRPLLATVPLTLVALLVPLAQAGISALRADLSCSRRSTASCAAMTGIVAFLHLLQPVARLHGRLKHGLTLWRQRGDAGLALPAPSTFPLVVTRYRLPEVHLRAVQDSIREAGGVVLNGGDYDRWDFEVRASFFGSTRVQMAFEDTGSGTQLVRARAWPRARSGFAAMFFGAGALAVFALADRANISAAVLGALAIFVATRVVLDCAVTMRAVRHGLQTCGLLAESTPPGTVMAPGGDPS